MSAPSGGHPLPPAARPTGAGRVGVVGPLLALALLALAVVAAREALVAQDLATGLTGGRSWAAPVLDAAGGLTPTAGLTAAGVALALLGVWLVLTGLARRSRRTVGIAGTPAATTTTRDVARLATGTARQQDGVLSASTRAGRRTVDVSVTATTTAVRDTVTAAVTASLTHLDPAPRVRVSVSAPSGTGRGARGGAR
ncbi:DUF6286 domain-containing protein [Kineococcus sp. SYSU DK001]|uniref:DUF6286 domain-containing protein n=1 Tax=Kineococcus sp. SYSU DK001 TaxID=3383122 RepID=UPI003D7D0D2F